MIGTSIGPYRVVDKLGEGGMGEVYRARDTRLDRDVALKIVPSAFASDPDRLARFEREAKTLAALNHPHIAQIHGLERSDGISALVMELVEGETLAERIARGALPLDEVIPIARQIAEAVEAAHEKGIIHRDLKPANVKVTRSDAVKVLDFGLAKELQPASDGSSHSLTLTSPAMTRDGVILGTAAYMSPEQARGRPVDKRSDIWAFGCVLFEMLTGRLAFPGASVTDTLSAITRDEPEWRRLPETTPAPIQALLRRCLEKDPNRRLRDIGEARITLSQPAAVFVPAPPAATRAPARAPWIAGIVAGIAAGALVGYFVAPRAAPAPGVVKTSFMQLTDQPGFERQPTISPDGRSVVFVSDARGNADLYLLRVGGRNAVLLTGDSDADDYAPAFSRDGNLLAFRSERAGGGIFVMEATGESVRRVTDAGFDPHWSPDGKALVVADEAVVDPMSRSLRSALWVVNLSDGTRRRLVEADAVAGKWSPSGRRIAYWARNSDTGNRDLFTVATDAGTADNEPVAVTSDAWVDWGPTWSPDGRFLYFASNRGGTMNLWRIAVDEATGRVQGAPEALTTPMSWSGWYELTADGRRVVFAELNERTIVWAAAFDPDHAQIVGRPRAVLQGLAINSIDLTRDGDRIAFAQRGQPWEAVGTIRVDGSGWSRLTDDDVYHRMPVWTPDGRHLTFYRITGVWQMRDDGSGLNQIVLPRELGRGVAPIWSPRGDQLAVAADTHFGIVDVTTTPPRLVAADPTSLEETGFLPFSWSPDGRWIAGTNRRGDRNRDQIYVMDAQSGADGLKAPRLVARVGKSPAWLPDSRRLLHSSPTGIVVLDVEAGTEREILPLPRTELLWGRVISLSRDGRTLVYLQSQNEGDLWLMTLEQ